MLRPIIRPLLRPLLLGLLGSKVMRWAYYFDGINDYGTLTSRAIDPNADIDIEWEQQGGVLNAQIQNIVNQSLSNTITSREFVMRWDNGLLSVLVGGTPVILTSYSIAQTDGKWRFTLIGTVATVYKNDVVVYTNPNRPRGAEREPTAVTAVAARNNAGNYTEFFQGMLYNIKINGILWTISTKDSVTQASQPAGNTLTLANSDLANWTEIEGSTPVLNIPLFIKGGRLISSGKLTNNSRLWS